MTYYIITFDTTHDALKAEKLLLKGTIVPVPSEISAGCGFAVRVDEWESAYSILKGSSAFSDIYRITGVGIAKIIEKVNELE